MSPTCHTGDQYNFIPMPSGHNYASTFTPGCNGNFLRAGRPWQISIDLTSSTNCSVQCQSITSSNTVTGNVMHTLCDNTNLYFTGNGGYHYGATFQLPIDGASETASYTCFKRSSDHVYVESGKAPSEIAYVVPVQRQGSAATSSPSPSPTTTQKSDAKATKGFGKVGWMIMAVLAVPLLM